MSPAGKNPEKSNGELKTWPKPSGNPIGGAFNDGDACTLVWEVTTPIKSTESPQSISSVVRGVFAPTTLAPEPS